MIFNMVGGGAGGVGGGATLLVSSPANVSVTVSKDDKSYTKNSGSLGSATFKGLATGTWTVTISGNGQTATKTIEITADYAITIAFFSASINITYPATSTCVVTNSSGQTVASDTNSTSSEKTFTAIVGATGTYTVTATATDGSGKSKSQSVSITTDGQSKSVTLSYKLILFDSGTYAEETGGFSRTSDNCLYSYSRCKESSTEEYGKWSTNNAIDLTGYSTLHFTVKTGTYGVGDSDAYNAACVKVGISTAKESTSFVASKNVSDGSFTTYTLDISSNQDSYYIVGYTNGGDWASVVKVTTCYISKLWLT